MPSFVRFVVAVFLLCSAASTVRAEDRLAARQAFQEGRKQYDLGEYEKALASFKRAYLEHEDPVFLFNLAQCQRALGQKQEAINAYRSYLRNAKNPPNRTEVQGFMASLETSLAADRAAAERAVADKAAAERAATEKAAAEKVASEAKAPIVAPAPVAAAPPRTPIYKKWWLWTAVGLVAAGAVTGIALGATLGSSTQTTLTPVVIQ